MQMILRVLMRIMAVVAVFLPVSLLMGKKHVGELSVLDLMIALTLGSVAGADLGDLSVSQGPTLTAIVGLGLVQIILTSAYIRSRVLNRVLTLSPAVVVQNGIVINENLATDRYTVEDLLSHLREKDVFDLAEVEVAILEPNGMLSVLKKSQFQPATPKDMGIPTGYRGLATAVILEGKVHYEGLNALHLTDDWLQAELSKAGYASVNEVFLAMLNTAGELYISPYANPLPPQEVYH